MLEKARLKASIKRTNSSNNRAAKKVLRRVETNSLFGTMAMSLFKAFVLIFFGIIVMFPFYYMISGSLMSNDEILHTDLGNTPILIPSEPNFDNYNRAFAEGYWDAFFFSLTVMIFQVIFKIVVCLLMGYAFGRFEFKGKKVLWALLMLTLMVPEVAILSGQFWVSKHIVTTDGIFRVILCLIGPFTASIFTIYIFRNGFEAIDDSVKEAALIDEISGFRFFIKIAIPMIAPIIWTQMILTALASWNSYMWPSLILGTSSAIHSDTIPLWLFSIGNTDSMGNTYPYTEVKLAGSFLAIIPTVIFYLIFRKRINMTVAGSANKG